jgi:hypothetical protein
MPLPVGVETRTVRLTVPLDTLGNVPKVYAGDVRPDRTVVWAATGDRLWPIGAQLPAVVDGAILFDVPRVDQDGWIDKDGAPITNWSYRLTVRATWDVSKRAEVREFQVFIDTPDPVDIELLPSGATLPVDPDVASYVISVVGRSGPVTGSQIVEAIRDELGDEFAELIDLNAEYARATDVEVDLQEQIDAWTPAGAFKGAWSAVAFAASDLVTYSGGLYAANAATIGTDVPGVSAKWTQLPTTVDTVARAAIGDATTLVRKTDPGIPSTNVNVVKLPDGTVLDEVTLDADDKILNGRYGSTMVQRVLRLGNKLLGDDFSLFRTSSGSSIVGSVGAHPGTGSLAEDAIGSDGTVPMWILNRWMARLGLSAGPSFTGGRSAQPMDIVLVLSQSNGTKRGYVAPLNGDTDWLAYWNLTFNAWANEGTTGPWLGSGFARAWWRREAMLSGRRVGAVECGVGGTGFSFDYVVNVDGGMQSTNWDPTNVTAAVNLAIRAKNMALAALAAAPAGSRIVGVVWSQGEADRGQTGMANGGYAAKLDALIAWFRTQLGIADLPWVVTGFTPQLVKNNATGTADLLAQLEDTPRRVEHTSYLFHAPDDSDESGGVDEDVHWHPHATHRRGETIVVDPDPLCDPAFDVAVMNAAASRYRTPQNLRISRSGSAARITWRAPAARVISYTLQTCTDGTGAAWSTETLVPGTGLAGAITHHFDKTVAAGTPLWARVAAVCSTGTSMFTVEVKA